MLSASLPPVFSENAEISISEQDSFYSAEYPEAESDDGNPVFIYRLCVESEDGRVVKERKTIPTYYLYNVADKLITDIGRLPKGKYKIKVIAETPYGIRSEYIEKTLEV